VYVADDLVDDQTEIFAVRTDGSTERVRLNEPLDPDQAVSGLRITPDSRTVVFRVNEGYDAQELHAVPITGGTPVLLARSEPGLYLDLPYVDPTSTWAIHSRSGGSAPSQVVSVRLDGSAAATVLAEGLGSSPGLVSRCDWKDGFGVCLYGTGHCNQTLS
jgi:hypothetical protein